MGCFHFQKSRESLHFLWTKYNHTLQLFTCISFSVQYWLHKCRCQEHACPVVCTQTNILYYDHQQFSLQMKTRLEKIWMLMRIKQTKDECYITANIYRLRLKTKNFNARLISPRLKHSTWQLTAWLLDQKQYN